MTEEEWWASAEPKPMLSFLDERFEERRLMLFGAACCRRHWGLFTEDCRQAIEAAELYADRRCSADQLRAAREAIERVEPNESIPWWVAWLATFDLAMALEYKGRDMFDDAAENALAAQKGDLSDRLYLGAMDIMSRSVVLPELRVRATAELAAHATLLRDVVGNPFRAVALNPVWLTPTVTTLAAQMYDTLDFTAMPILADAIQDAGCNDAAILEHCRGDGPHVRGCWVVDLVLGKE